jgi:hypothetical protein
LTPSRLRRPPARRSDLRDWRAAYDACRQAGVSFETLTRIGRAVGRGTPSGQWTEGQRLLAGLLFPLLDLTVAADPQGKAWAQTLADPVLDETEVLGRVFGEGLQVLDLLSPDTAEGLRAIIRALTADPTRRPTPDPGGA